MTIEFAGALASNTRVQIRETRGADGQTTFALVKPKPGARFGRAVLNCVSHLACWIPGAKYTKNHYNPSQWRAFRNAVLATHSADITSGKLDLAAVDTILSTYSPHKRLTQAKAAAVLEDVRRAIDGQPLVARKPDRLNASQSAPLRGLRTLFVRCKGLSEQGRALSATVAGKEGEAAEAIRDVLRPGNTIHTPSITAGQTALEGYAAGKANFARTGRGMDNVSMGIRLPEIARGSAADIARLRQAALDEPGKPAILSIPLALFSKTFSLHEDHVVELAVDFRAQKLLFLDPKGESIERSSKTYDSGDIKAALEGFGHTLFGGDWVPATGIVQLTQAKQQGANDCGAFTHDFTRRLIDGQSVGDIERSFNKDDRWALRVRMADDIARTLPLPDPEADAGPVEGRGPIGGAGAIDVKAPPDNPAKAAGTASLIESGTAAVVQPGRDSFTDEVDFFDLKRQ
jgi:hypothetical protein